MVELGGRPLIAHTFATAQACTGIDRTFLSTDIPEALALAQRSYPKIEVPFVRPPELCRDETSQVEVVDHLLEHLENSERLVPDAIVLLQPTSPFRRIGEMAAALRTFHETGCQSLLGVAKVLHHPADYLYRKADAEAPFEWVMRAPEWRRRQDFPEVYFNTGALYICTTRYFLHHRQFYDQDSRLFVMAEESALDIDTPFDFQLAQGWWTGSSSEDYSAG